MQKKIKIGCEGTAYIELDELNEFQEDIKKITTENLNKLKESIKKSFKAPVFIWRNNSVYYLLDGHQRKKALEELRKEGWEIPKIPAVEIFADSEEEARASILDFTSQHGEFNSERLKLYIRKHKIVNKNIVLRNKPIVLTNAKREVRDNRPKLGGITKKGDLWELNSNKLFCGDVSNNTKLVGRKNGNIFYGMEMEPRKCDVIVNRYIEWCKKNGVRYKIKLNGKIKYEG